MTFRSDGRRRGAAALVLVSLLAACGQAAPALVMPGDGLGASQWHWGSNEPFTMSREFVVCLDSPGSARITDVAMRYVENGLRVDGFALVPRQELPEFSGDLSAPMTLAEAGYDGAAVTSEVESVCYEGGGEWSAHRALDDFTHLAIQFSKPHEQTAGGSGLLITYEAGGKERTLEWDLQVVLCGTSDSPASSGEQEAEVCDLLRLADDARDRPD